MTAVAVKSYATYIGPAADKAAALAGAAIGDFYFEDDTGILYRKNLAGDAWTVVVAGAGSAGTGAGTSGSSTATITVTGDNAASVSILAANANRKGVIIVNTSSAILYVKFGATAVIASDWSVQIPANGYWEMPAGRGIYTGILHGIWASDAGGSAFVTEW